MKNIIIFALIGLIFISYYYSGSAIIEMPYGSFNVINRQSSTVLAAPHGTYDINTGSILSNVCLRVKFSCVIASGFKPKGTRINVNRPTEGVGIKSINEPKTARATEVYHTFKEKILSVANQNLNLYIEVHGSGVNGIEVALHNISINKSRLIKKIIEEEWSKQNSNLIPIKVQGVDKIKMVANAVKNFGLVADLQPKFIAFEFSRPLRNKQDMLTEFLINSIQRINNVVNN